MELIEVIRHRRSVRKYTEDAIPDEVLEKILQAGLLAPTSRNRRPWEFYVVKDNMLPPLTKELVAGAEKFLESVKDYLMPIFDKADD